MKLRRRILIVGAVLVIGLIGYRVARTPNFDALKAQGKTLIEQIEAYHVAHGQYPQSLQQAQIKAPRTFFGRWNYRQFADSFELSVGEYTRDDFLLRYRPESGWYLND